MYVRLKTEVTLVPPEPELSSESKPQDLSLCWTVELNRMHQIAEDPFLKTSEERSVQVLDGSSAGCLCRQTSCYTKVSNVCWTVALILEHISILFVSASRLRFTSSSFTVTFPPDLINSVHLFI